MGRLRARNLLLNLLLIVVLAAACRQEEEQQVRVFLDVGAEARRIVTMDRPTIVKDVLEQAEIELGSDDRVNPSENTTISEGLVITVTRVTVDTPCEETVIPFDREVLPNEAMEPGEEHLAQTGRNGRLQVCYRVETVNGEEVDRVAVSRVVVEEPVNEIVFRGVAPPPPVRFEGTLAYLSNGNAWIMRGNSSTKRPLTIDGGLDGRVFVLSPNGRHLAFTRVVQSDADFFNSLWVIMDTRDRDPEAVELLPDNVLFAEWVPGVESTLSYSTSDARPASPGWQAKNDLWLITLDEDDAEILQVLNLVEESSGGLLGWWGTSFHWSPDGRRLAWARPDGVGTVNLNTRALSPLFDFPIYNTYGDWAWVPSLSWSPESNLLLTTIHAPPPGVDAPEDSPVFNVAISAPDAALQIADLIPAAGIWANPQFSPMIEDDEGNQAGYIAYLRPRSGLSASALDSQQYELVVADRDGSNARVVFPEGSQAPGLTPQTVAWSPDARHIAFIFQGDLWIVEVASGATQRLTADRSASDPRWVE
ncbi:MAG: G5 domain-containing protein [Anaerolineae bacterium]|nr:G5 domain-containing protein [Anaerolineae bacterium]